VEALLAFAAALVSLRLSADLLRRYRDRRAPELAAFGRRFGAPRPHALTKYRHVDCPEVSWLTNVEETGKIDWYGVKRATDWHTDSTFEAALPLLAMLHAKEVPSEKGGTMFADMRAAYDALPEARKQLLSGLTGLHGRSSGPAGERLAAGAWVVPAGALVGARVTTAPQHRAPDLLVRCSPAGLPGPHHGSRGRG